MVGLLATRGIDLGSHRAERFLPGDARRHDLILVMEAGHLRYIQAMAPELAGRVQLLGRWSVGVIPDPVGGPPEAYERCLEMLDRSVESWLNRLAGNA